MIKVLLLGIFIGATIGYITAALMAAPNYSEIPTSSTAKDNLAADCIDRQATLDAIIKRLGIKNETYLLEAERAIYQQILAMPSVTPQKPKIVPIAEIKYDEDKLKELVNKAVLTVTSQEPTAKDNLAVEEGTEINEVLDKIRAEIETTYGRCDLCEWDVEYDYEENDISEYREVGDIADILKIIDKYKAESEVDNGNDN